MLACSNCNSAKRGPIPLNAPFQYEEGPITRAEKLNAENSVLKMLLVNLTTACCPYALGEEATDALVEAHREASETLGLGCPNCVRQVTV